MSKKQDTTQGEGQKPEEIGAEIITGFAPPTDHFRGEILPEGFVPCLCTRPIPRYWQELQIASELSWSFKVELVKGW